MPTSEFGLAHIAIGEKVDGMVVLFMVIVASIILAIIIALPIMMVVGELVLVIMDTIMAVAADFVVDTEEAIDNV